MDCMRGETPTALAGTGCLMTRKSRSQWLDLLLGGDSQSRSSKPKRASTILRKLEVLEDRLAPSVSFQQVLPAPNQNYYPFTSSNPNTSIAFNESSMVEASAFNNTNATFDVFYNDEHAMALGVRQVNVITNSGTTTTNYAFSSMSSDPGAVTNPSVGATATSGDQAGNDTFGRPMFPSLFITDITNNPNDHSGDWQSGGTAIAPSAVFGAWKGFVRTVDNRNPSNPQVTVTGDSDPAQNDWNLGLGADAPPAGLNDLGYGTEVRWDLNQLYQQGLLQAGHTYRFYVIVHDGDQTKGGDSGQAAVNVTIIQNPGIAGTVWLDSNGNAVQDNGEGGVSGVTVYLTNSSNTTIGTATTDATGSYSFNGLTAGTYSVQFVAPSGYSFSTAASDTVTLTGGQTENINAGLFQPDSVSGDVWIDSNANAVQDAGEGALASVTVNLVSGGTTISTAVTDANGDYSFAGLSPGDYTVQFTAPANYEFSTPSSEAFTLVSGQSEQVDAGVFQDGTVSGIAWLDNNANGVLDAGENGLAGVTVYLLDNTSATVGSGTTDSSGNYSITNVPPGSYIVQFAPPSGYVLSTAATDDVTLTSGQSDGNEDVGLFQPATINGEVWSDTNANGTMDAGEAGLSGVTVNLVSGTTTLSSTSTDANGNYSFTGLTPGGYSVQFVAPSGDLFSTPSSDAVTLTSGQTSSFNAGLYQNATLGGNAWVDANDNSVKDAGESNLPGVTVYLLNNSSTTIGTATTDASGNYGFANLTPGSYAVQFTAPSGYSFSTPASDASDVVTLTSGQANNTINAGFFQPAVVNGEIWTDSNANGAIDTGENGLAGVTVNLVSGTTTLTSTTTDASGNYSFTGLNPGGYLVQFVAPAGDLFSTPSSDAFTLTSGQSDTFNAGLFQNATLGGNAWVDSNDNAAKDAGEANLPSVTVYLLDSTSATIGTATTDANGNYSFANLTPGSYSVQFTAPNGYSLSTPATVSSTLTSGQTNNNLNAGFFQPGGVNGEVWSDTNANGAMDAGENALTGVTVNLVSGITTLRSTTTDANGNYSFTGLNPGSYSVQFVAPTGDLFSTPSSDAFTLTSGQSDSFNAGVYQNATISGNTWLDSNADGVKNPGENNVAGVTVYLLNSSSATIGTATTDASGNFSFANLTPGSYTVKFVAPSGDQFSTPSTDSLTLTSSQTGTANAGLFQPNSLAGKVYLDANANGTHDATETGIAGVTVVLTGTDTSGNSITPQTVTTDANGNFQFSINPSGNFTLTETSPAGYLDGKDTAGIAGGTAGTDQISAITLSGRTNGTGYNFAEVQGNTLSGTVFNDLNNNGQQNTGELGIAGVTMTLTGANDLNQSVSLTTTTDASGNYSFANLRPGSYLLTQTLPPTWLAGKNTPGAAGVTNSNETMQTFQLTSGQAVAGNLFGDLLGAQVTGVVYNDLNHNGVQDPGEPGLAGVTMTFTGTDDQGTSVSLTLTTASDGSFAFTNLRPGQYSLQETQPPQFQPGTNAVGTQGGTQTSPGTISNFTLAPGQTGNSNNFGQWQPSSVAGKVYLDSNDNGQQDPGEPNLSGVTLTLTDVSNGTTVTQTTTTGVDGTFIFSNLTPGIYSVTERQPAGLFIGTNQLGTGGGALNGNTMSNISVGANNQFIN
jgi:uncharacterized surface anchored protein